MFKAKKHTVFEDFDALQLNHIKNEICFDVPYEKIIFNTYFYPKTEKRLFVLLNGAVDREKELPRFQRWQWVKYFPGSVLCVSDPTLTFSPTLRNGWYIGDKSLDVTEGLKLLVIKLAEELALEHNQVFTYGSSGGGFASLMLASKLKDACAIAINPQTNVFNHTKTKVDNFLKLFYGTTNGDSAGKDLLPRLSTLSSLSQNKNCRVLYVQNRQDVFHFKRHFRPFAKHFGLPLTGGYNPDKKMYCLMYDAPGGHGPESKEMVPEILNWAFSL